MDHRALAELGVRYLVVGDDFRFGHERRGDFAMLEAAGRDHGFRVAHMYTHEVEGERVSSTRIREALQRGDLEPVVLVVGGQLVDVLAPTGEVDIDGNPILDTVSIGSPASIAGARASGQFFSVFEEPTHSHYNMLSGAERRLIAEWLDVGAQYYNNPFDAPEN